jgi:hypothetical protein
MDSHMGTNKKYWASHAFVWMQNNCHEPWINGPEPVGILQTGYPYIQA